MSTLRLLHVIHRHGDRAPQYGCLLPGSIEAVREGEWWRRRILDEETQSRLEPLFSRKNHEAEDPPKKRTPFGDLTKRGSLQVFEMGRVLRQRYWEALRGAPNLRVYASNYERTLQSARCGLLGFFSPFDSTPYRMNDEEVSSYTRPSCPHLIVNDVSRDDFENALSSHGNASLPCITVREREKDVIDSFSRNDRLPQRVNEILERDADLYVAKEKSIGLSSESKRALSDAMPGLRRPLVWFDVGDTLYCNAAHASRDSEDDVLSPEILAQSDLVHQYLTWRFVQYYNDGPLLRLAVSHLMEEIARDASAVLNAPSTAKTPPDCIWMSGHDVTIMPLLRAIGAWDERWAPYAAYLAIELHEAGAGDWELRFVYNDSNVATLSFHEFEQAARAVRGVAGAPSTGI